MVRKTFYGDVYSTINEQFAHIINVQITICTDGTGIETETSVSSSALHRADEEKYLAEGNRLYKNKRKVGQSKNSKKIICMT